MRGADDPVGGPDRTTEGLGVADRLDGVADGLADPVPPGAADGPPCDPQAASSTAAHAPPQMRAALATACQTAAELMFMSTLPGLRRE